VNNPLLNMSIEGAMGVLFNVSGGPSLKLGEVNETGEYIRSLVDPDALIFFGMGNDRSLKDRARVTLIATGIPSLGSGDHREHELAKLLNNADDGFGKIDLDLPPFIRNPRLFDKNR
jgi:cell division protein FtsZ